ncbi:L-seryl-tRNA(Sec) selenium transferase [Citricoccus zhacaiensis]|uniref:L-seryl-tRNA(Sec) selenium transferase n=1 Tax=Citricoccus zhacaiensis TaxID=489142 RepID=A0ABQ2LZC2_9MICC|nr:L-seryl-tRNA(Sec) selenium transferase [Citricoccus zhacaiensis]GGO44962.1 L-seryl-tRNA(Sec) selenium transferase [Citricoccus zhacaiensis]
MTAAPPGRSEDPRRRIPRTDTLLALPEVVDARSRLSEAVLRSLITQAQSRARSGEITPEDVAPSVRAAVADRTATTLRPVLNATGVVVHTNLGRAPLSPPAVEALVASSGYVDVELDLANGQRAKRGTGTRQALLAAVPAAVHEAIPEGLDALVVNNGAAALVLATTALTGTGELIVSRGELVEIGAGFRLPDLITSTGTRLREVGTTNRTHRADYAGAIGPQTTGLLKVHPSNFRVDGFTSAVSIEELRTLVDEAAADSDGRSLPLIVDIGSGLLTPDPLLPDEPDLAGALTAGADVVIASGDKLLGGPQAGILLGRSRTIQRLATHPLARAVRADKLTLAALEATLTGGSNPVTRSLHAEPARLRERADRLAVAVGAPVVAHEGRVGGGGAPGVPLAGWAVRFPEELAPLLRTGEPAVLPRVHDGACLVDLRCIPEPDDGRLAAAIRDAQARLASAGRTAGPGNPASPGSAGVPGRPDDEPEHPHGSGR